MGIVYIRKSTCLGGKWVPCDKHDKGAVPHAPVPRVVYVVMGNDYPGAVFTNLAVAERYCVERVSENKRVFWRAHAFVLDKGNQAEGLEMPDVGHVIDCARHLKAAHAAFVKMVESGSDGGRALNMEFFSKGCDMGAECAQAASVWTDFLLGMRDPGWYDDNDEEEDVAQD